MIGTKTNVPIEALRQHQLVILRRLRSGPLTEFELASEVAEHSGHTIENASDKMSDWLGELRAAGLIWAGPLTNDVQQVLLAAALTARGRKLVT